MVYKSKEQLNLMSKSEINDFRIKLLSQRILSDDDIRFNKEMDYYTKLRFKEDEFAMYERFSLKKDDPKADKLEKDACKLISEIIDKMGREEYYNFNMSRYKELLGEMIFIKL